MPSRRLPWEAERNRLTTLLQSKSGERLLDLTESNPTRAGFAYPEREILEALADPRVFRYEPDPRGRREAREAVAAAHGVSAESVLITASTSEAYAYLFKMLCDPGDAVLVPRPSYPLFDHLAALEGVRVAPYDLDPDGGWAVRIGNADGARAVVAVNPNNPTGSFLSDADLDAIAATGLPLISDEVFAEYAFEAPRPARRRPDLPVFTLGGLSKSAGLPQLKLGWIIATGPGAAVSLDRLAAVADAYLSVSAPVMLAAPTLLPLAPRIREPIAARSRANLHALAELAGPRLRRPQGGWYAPIEAPDRKTDEEWALELVDQDSVIVHPGYFYDFPRDGFLVVSLIAPEADFREGIRRVVSRF